MIQPNHVIEPFSESDLDIAAARTVSGEANGIFLEPMFKGTYPEHMFPYLPCLNDSKIVQSEDLKIISAPCYMMDVDIDDVYLNIQKAIDCLKNWL